MGLSDAGKRIVISRGRVISSKPRRRKKRFVSDAGKLIDARTGQTYKRTGNKIIITRTIGIKRVKSKPRQTLLSRAKALQKSLVSKLTKRKLIKFPVRKSRIKPIKKPTRKHLSKTQLLDLMNKNFPRGKVRKVKIRPRIGAGHSPVKRVRIPRLVVGAVIPQKFRKGLSDAGYKINPRTGKIIGFKNKSKRS